MDRIVFRRDPGPRRHSLCIPAKDKAEGDRLREAFAQLDVAAVRKLLD